MQISLANKVVYILESSDHVNCQCIEQSRVDWHRTLKGGRFPEQWEIRMWCTMIKRPHENSLWDAGADFGRETSRTPAVQRMTVLYRWLSRIPGNETGGLNPDSGAQSRVVERVFD
jgi:hypothetical protein